MQKIQQKMKSFEDNLEEQFSNFKVLVPNFPRDFEHFYADFIELIALFSNKSFVTASDIIDRLKDEGELRKAEDQDKMTVSEENDKNEAWINSIFKIIEERSALFDTDYPFDHGNNRIILTERLTTRHQVYIFLLISSNLQLFQKVRSSLTTDFEVVSYYALKSYLPAQAIVKQFGKRSDYSGNAKEKIRNLAKDLNVEVREHEMENISDRNNQERGLDVIGWIPFGDKCPNFFTVLAQCACGKDWASKHHDTKRYIHYLRFYRLKPFHALFIPYSLVGKSGGTRFYRSDDVEEGTLIFDRKRITELFLSETDFNGLESKRVVEECIMYVEDIL